MKKNLLIVMLCLAVLKGYTQQPAVNPFPKTITVTGSAQMEVIPDEIYVNVLLREYQKKNENKRELEVLKAEFLASCGSVGIADSSISIASYTGYNNYYLLRKKKKKDPDLFGSITYQIRFSSSKQMDELIEKLDDEATQSFDIAYTSHSKMTEFRKQLKIEAVKAAKNKATYLTDAINEKLGAAITVKEPEEPGMNTVNVSNFRSQAIIYENNYKLNGGNDKSIEVDFKKIKLRYEVNVIFALQ
jgi:uncharacterized protein